MMHRRRPERSGVRRSLRRNPDTAAPPVRAGRQKIVRVLEVVDTRQYEEIEEGVFKPIPGTGSPHLCSRCGRTHEVHALVELDDGQTELVGTGCASKASMDVAAQVKTEMARQKNIDKWTRVLASLERRRALWDAATKAVDAMPVPPVERVGPVPARFTDTIGMLWRCGDETEVDPFWGERQARIEAEARPAFRAELLGSQRFSEDGHKRSLAIRWRQRRLAEFVGPEEFRRGYPSDEEHRSATRKLKALRLGK